MANTKSNKPAPKDENKPKRKTNGRPPQIRPEPVTPEDFALQKKLLTETLHSYLMPKCDKTDEALAERFSEYFKYCAENNVVPVVEDMYMYTGWNWGYLNDIEAGRRKGFTSETATIIKKAKNFMMNYDAKMVASGKLNPVVYIFRGKNYYGLKDQQEVNLTAGNTDDVDANDIRNKYIKEHYPIETTAKEVEN